MILRIHELYNEEHIALDVKSWECDFPAEIGTFVTPIHVEAHIRKIEKKITIMGRLATTLEMTCARCLKLHQTHVGDAFEVVYSPQPATLAQEDELELSAEELNLSYYTGDAISLLELVRDQLLLVLPLQPLCRPDCAGVCPSCGKDLNEGPCACVPDKLDPRLAILGQLLKHNVKGEIYAKSKTENIEIET